MTLRERYDRELGAASGIPSCCIEFFVKVWIPRFEALRKKMRIRSNSSIERWRRFALEGDWILLELGSSKEGLNYIPCPRCHQRQSYIKVKRTPNFPRFREWKEKELSRASHV